MNTTRRRFLGMGAALAVVPKTVLAAPVVPVRQVVGLKDWLCPRDSAPAGLVSGIALREWHDITQRRAIASSAAYLDVNRAMAASVLALSRQMYEGRG
jgi:hypothetical protein